MGMMLVTLIFLGLVAVWIALPFVPGLREIRERRDVEPLRVVRDSDVQIEHFARGFRSYLERELGAPWSRARHQRVRVEGALEDGTRYVVLPRGGGSASDLTGVAMRPCEAVVLACGDLKVPEASVFLLEVFAEGRIETGPRCLLRALASDGDLCFGAESQVLRWAHARATVRAEPGCELYGRLSAGHGIELARGCRFDRLHAPRIAFGRTVEPVAPRVTATRLESSDLIGVTDVAAGRWRVKGDALVPEGAVLEADLVVGGAVFVEAGARILGSIKARRDLTLDRGVEVRGSVVARRDVKIGPGCRIHGPVISERGVVLAAGATVGSLEKPTTVTCATLIADEGAVAHGTVWAHHGAIVRAAAAAAVASRLVASPLAAGAA